MVKEKPSSSEQKLKELITETVGNAADVNQVSIEIQKNSQQIIDQGIAILSLIPYIDDNERNRQIMIWSETKNQLGSISSHLGNVQSSTDYAVGTASTSSASVIAFVYENETSLSAKKGFISAYSDFKEFSFNNSELFEKIIDQLILLHLDKSSGNKQSPLAFFNIAISSYNYPVSEDNPAITSLIPLRESISSSIDYLLKYRPKQEKTGHSDMEKIKSIVNQLKKDITSSAMVNQWSDQWHKINDEDLSDSKKSIITRSEWTARLYRAANFYYGFLSGLDPARLRKRKIKTKISQQS